MPFVTVLATKDLLSAVSSNLDPRHLGNLRLVCKQLAGSIDAAVQAKSVQDAVAKYARAVLLLGVPSSPTAKGTERRKAIRAAWLLDEHVGRTVVVCFLLLQWRPQVANNT
jgi:uncharacterized membrane protein